MSTTEFTVAADDKPGTLRHALDDQPVPKSSLRSAGQIDEQTRENADRPKNWSPKYAMAREVSRRELAAMELAPHRDLNKREAQAITKQIRSAVGDLMTLIVKAYQGRAWVALGYESWPTYIKAEFGHAPIFLPRKERNAVEVWLRGQGMSTRAIAPAVGVDQATVVRDLGTDANASVENVVSLDGKRRPAKRRAESAPETIGGTLSENVKELTALSKRRPAKREGLGRRNQRHQIHALDEILTTLNGYAGILEGLFEDGFQKTCTVDVRNEKVAAIRAAIKQISGQLRAISGKAAELEDIEVFVEHGPCGSWVGVLLKSDEGETLIPMDADLARSIADRLTKAAGMIGAGQP